MMFTFSINEVLPLLKHSLKCKKHCKLYDQKGTDVPGLWLVKDAGTYLLSNSTKLLMQPDGKSQRVAYASGWGPDETHLGGDDFVELIAADWLADIFRQADAKGRDAFNITLTETTIKLSV